MKKEISEVNQEYQDIYVAFSLKDQVLEKIKHLLYGLSELLKEVSTEEMLEECTELCDESYLLLEELVEQDEIEKEIDSIGHKIDEEEEKVEEKKKNMDSMTKEYSFFVSQEEEIASTLDSHTKKIDDYLAKIDKIRAYEVIVYQSNVLNKTLKFTEKLIKRSVEGKIAGLVIPKSVANVYFAAKLVQDTKKIMQEDITITRKEIDTSYYDDIRKDQDQLQDYRTMVSNVLFDVEKMKAMYQQKCKNYPTDGLYDENIKKLEELECNLIEQNLKVDELESEYDQVIDYHENKVKVLKDT